MYCKMSDENSYGSTILLAAGIGAAAFWFLSSKFETQYHIIKCELKIRAEAVLELTRQKIHQTLGQSTSKTEGCQSQDSGHFDLDSDSDSMEEPADFPNSSSFPRPHTPSESTQQTNLLRTATQCSAPASEAETTSPPHPSQGDQSQGDQCQGDQSQGDQSQGQEPVGLLVVHSEEAAAKLWDQFEHLKDRQSLHVADLNLETSDSVQFLYDYGDCSLRGPSEPDRVEHGADEETLLQLPDDHGNASTSHLATMTPVSDTCQSDVVDVADVVDVHLPTSELNENHPSDPQFDISNELDSYNPESSFEPSVSPTFSFGEHRVPSETTATIVTRHEESAGVAFDDGPVSDTSCCC